MFQRIPLLISAFLWGVLVFSGCEVLYFSEPAYVGERVVYYLIIPASFFILSVVALFLSRSDRLKPAGCIAGTAGILLLLPYLMFYTGGM